MVNKKAEVQWGLQLGVGLLLIARLRFHPLPLFKHTHMHAHRLEEEKKNLINNVATAVPPTASNTAHPTATLRKDPRRSAASLWSPHQTTAGSSSCSSPANPLTFVVFEQLSSFGPVNIYIFHSQRTNTHTHRSRNKRVGGLISSICSKLFARLQSSWAWKAYVSLRSEYLALQLTSPSSEPPFFHCNQKSVMNRCLKQFSFYITLRNGGRNIMMQRFAQWYISFFLSCKRFSFFFLRWLLLHRLLHSTHSTVDTHGASQ